MAVMREAAQIMRGNLDQSRRTGPLQNTVLEGARKEAGKDRNDIEVHGQ
jgi:hypothetical protein